MKQKILMLILSFFMVNTLLYSKNHKNMEVASTKFEYKFLLRAIPFDNGNVELFLKNLKEKRDFKEHPFNFTEFDKGYLDTIYILGNNNNARIYKQVFDLLKENYDRLKKRNIAMKDSFEHLFLLKKINDNERGEKMLDTLESSRDLFNPFMASEVFWKMRYYLEVEDLKEVKYTFDDFYPKAKLAIINKSHSKSIIPVDKKRVKRIKKTYKYREIKLSTMYKIHILNMGYFIYSDNIEKQKEIKKIIDIAYELYQVPAIGFFYDQYLFNFYTRNYGNALKYVKYVEQNYEGFKYGKEEVFAVASLSLRENAKERNWADAWNAGKDSILYGLELDYEKFSDKVIENKRLFNLVAREYIVYLYKHNREKYAKEIYEKTNKILAKSNSILF